MFFHFLLIEICRLLKMLKTILFWNPRLNTTQNFKYCFIAWRCLFKYEKLIANYKNSKNKHLTVFYYWRKLLWTPSFQAYEIDEFDQKHLIAGTSEVCEKHQLRFLNMCLVRKIKFKKSHKINLEWHHFDTSSLLEVNVVECNRKSYIYIFLMLLPLYFRVDL